MFPSGAPETRTPSQVYEKDAMIIERAKLVSSKVLWKRPQCDIIFACPNTSCRRGEDTAPHGLIALTSIRK